MNKFILTLNWACNSMEAPTMASNVQETYNFDSFLKQFTSCCIDYYTY